MDQPATGSPMHPLTLGLMQTGLQNMMAIMDKAKAEAAGPGTNLAGLLEARLHPGMFNLLQQLQYMAYISVEFARHFTSTVPPRVGYDETSWDELHQSLQKAASYLASVSPAAVEHQAGKVVPIFMDETRGMSLLDYAARVMVPDFHFHMVVAYGLLRQNGITIGKSDYLGTLKTVSLAK